jgi:hypothetical protein
MQVLFKDMKLTLQKPLDIIEFDGRHMPQGKQRQAANRYKQA